ncbi:MAG TPA: MCE family protein [Acidimicrobiales bacterium]|jgi:phospholipid/cholesterol/gamma-HCH transport system substrate-binding protein|nr:MCE family protein [Acidimicrobiales bacterium]
MSRARSSRLIRRGAAFCVVVALVAGTAGCLTGGASSTKITANAVFSDAEDLVPGAQVQMADVPIGQVTAISLDGSNAKVTMSIDKSARVPADATAALDQTTILGEHFVQLKVPSGPGSTHPALLANGATIAHTTVIPNVEQFISAGAQVFGSVSTNDLAQIIAAGGQGFDGQAASLRQLLNSLSTVTAGYASHTSDIQTVITSLDQLGSTLAPSSSADAQAVSNLAQTVSILAQQSGRFTDLLQALNSVSSQGRSLLETYFPQISDQLTALGAVANQLGSHQQDLLGLLKDLPLHNTTLPRDVVNNFVQVLDDLIVCGIPGGGADPSSPALTCGSAG